MPHRPCCLRFFLVSRISADQPPRYLRYRPRQVRPSLGDAAALRHLLDFVRAEGVMAAQKRAASPLIPAERWTQAYAQHLKHARGHARGLASATIANHVPFIRRFLKERFGDGPVTLSQLCAPDVVSFVQRQVPRLHPKRAKLLTSALRSRRSLRIGLVSSKRRSGPCTRPSGDQNAPGRPP